MTLKISSGELYKTLQLGLNAIPSKAIIGILYDFLFEVRGNKLTITSSDLEFTIISELDVIADEDGAFTFPAEILINTLRELSEQPIEIKYSSETSGLELTSAYGIYRSSSGNIEEYPKLPEIANFNQVIIPADRFNKALNTCTFAAATDEMKIQMQGISVAIMPDAVVLAATDAHKLVKYTLYHDNDGQDQSFIIPKKTASVLKHILNDDSPLTITYASKHVLFSYKNTEVYCKLIEQVFPKYNSVIPIGNDKEVLVNRLDFLQSLKRIAIYGNKTTFQATLQIADNEIKIYTQDIDFSNEASESIKCQYTNEPMELNYNIRYLIESLSNLTATEVCLALSQPNKAAILRPKTDEIGENIIMLVMPVMTRKSYND